MALGLIFNAEPPGWILLAWFCRHDQASISFRNFFKLASLGLVGLACGSSAKGSSGRVQFAGQLLLVLYGKGLVKEPINAQGIHFF